MSSSEAKDLFSQRIEVDMAMEEMAM